MIVWPRQRFVLLVEAGLWVIVGTGLAPVQGLPLVVVASSPVVSVRLSPCNHCRCHLAKSAYWIGKSGTILFKEGGDERPGSPQGPLPTSTAPSTPTASPYVPVAQPPSSP